MRCGSVDLLAGISVALESWFRAEVVVCDGAGATLLGSKCANHLLSQTVQVIVAILGDWLRENVNHECA